MLLSPIIGRSFNRQVYAFCNQIDLHMLSTDLHFQSKSDCLRLGVVGLFNPGQFFVLFHMQKIFIRFSGPGPQVQDRSAPFAPGCFSLSFLNRKTNRCFAYQTHTQIFRLIPITLMVLATFWICCWIGLAVLHAHMYNQVTLFILSGWPLNTHTVSPNLFPPSFVVFLPRYLFTLESHLYHGIRTLSKPDGEEEVSLVSTQLMILRWSELFLARATSVSFFHHNPTHL